MDYHVRKTVDLWLMEIGYYRKHIAMDETCLFRAVSDQMYNTQSYHEAVRMACIEYANENVVEFRSLVGDWDEYIYKLTNHSVICGPVEMQILAKKYKRDFIIFDGLEFKISNVTKNGFTGQFLLCRMKDYHYDTIVKKDYIDKASYCQALLYKVLYEKVFHLDDDLDETVSTMLYPAVKDNSLSLVATNSENIKETVVHPPFPFKVAKALDPEQYRNIEYDAWNQSRKETRIKDWYLGGSDFKIGTKCLLNAENHMLSCYIQDMNLGSKEYCLVYVIEAAERRKVKVADLKPMPDAKPWPMPFVLNRNSKKVKLPWNEQTENFKNTRKPSKQIKKNNSTEITTNSRDKNYSFEIDDGKNISFEINDKTLSIENNNTVQSAAHLEGCPLVKSLTTQIQEIHLDSANNNAENYTNNNVDNYTNSALEIHTNNVENYDDWKSNNSTPESVWYDVWEPTAEELSPVVQDEQTVAQFGLPVQNIPLVLPTKSVSPNGADLPFHDVYSLRYYFNIGVESVRQNYQQMWLPIQNSAPLPPPYIMPPNMCCPYPNQQMCLSAQYNMYQQNSDSRFTFYSQVIKGTYNMNNNNYYEPNNYIFDAPPPPMNIQPPSGDMFIPQMEMPAPMGPMLMSPPPTPYCSPRFVAPPPPFGIPSPIPNTLNFFKF